MNLDMIDYMKTDLRIALQNAGLSSPIVIERILHKYEAQIIRAYNQGKIEVEVQTTS